MLPDRTWQVYLAGEIHSPWRQRITELAEAAKLPVTMTGPVTDHDASDNCGVKILGPEPDNFWKDHKSASINSIRTRWLIEQADLVVVRFGEKYRQWNAAFDAGVAVTLGKPLITLHAPELDHALKEIDAAAHVTARDPDQVVEILTYLIQR